MRNSSMPKKLQYPLSRSECLCAICREILLEPVTLPCDHTLCLPCFQMTVEKASLCCPFCRLRVSSWARHSTRSGTLVNQELWDFIQRQYPEDCKRRASGLETEDDEFEDGFTPFPTLQLCEPGEIRQEYEAEISKIEAERLRIEEEERKASEDYIKKLLAEEEEEQRLALERAQRDLEEQLKKDEELAWMLNSNLNESKASSGTPSPETSPVNLSKTFNAKSSKSIKGKASQSGDIERFLSPVSVKVVHIEQSRHVADGYTLHINDSVEHAASLLEDSDDDAMPTLSPQFSTVKGGSLQGSDTELQLPDLTENYPIGRSATQSAGLFTKHVSQRMGNDSCISISSTELSPPRCSTSQDHYRRWRKNSEDSSICSTPTHLHKTTLKRTLASSGDEDHVNEKRPKMSSLDNSTELGSRTEKLKELEENLHERKLQEEQDRLLALQLQKLLDKEQKQVSRQKGSPDEYKLRPKRTPQEPSETESQEKASSKCNTKGSESGDSPDENKKPAPPKCAPSRPASGRTRKASELSSSPHGGKILKPSNKQQTILDMFQRSKGN
ncbi:E3 ubiquitin-protein ligase RNF168 [Hyperolius riggenbachi]|uniref:E3 ubiquitin-protein ligase RNF168 n=1 Tax=Hyperolius riggenbachi TaxID=752182 RepID=UPI0035A39764